MSTYETDIENKENTTESTDEVESQEFDSVRVSLLNISNWIQNETPYMDSTKAYDDMMDDAILDPDKENSTEFGEVPHAEEKGSILQHNLFAPYLYGRYTY